jgi:hypothetical protein
MAISRDFKVLLDSQGRTEPVPDTHEVLCLDTFSMKRYMDKPLQELQQEYYKIGNLERISWIEDQGWEYDIFLANVQDFEQDCYIVKMMLILPKPAAVLYLLRYCDEV